MKLQEEIVALTVLSRSGGPRRRGKKKSLLSLADFHVLSIKGGTRPDLYPYDLPTEEELHVLQEFVSERLDEIVRTGVTRFPAISLALQVEKKGHTLGLVELPDQAFAFVFANLLGDQVKNIRHCPECQKRFLAHRYNQSFCTTKCQNRAAARKYRNTPPDRVGKRGRPRKISSEVEHKAKTKGDKRYGKKKGGRPRHR